MAREYIQDIHHLTYDEGSNTLKECIKYLKYKADKEEVKELFDTAYRTGYARFEYGQYRAKIVYKDSSYTLERRTS